MKNKVFKVEVMKDCFYYVLASSTSQAILETCKVLTDIDPSEFTESDVTELDSTLYHEVEIDYLYMEDRFPELSMPIDLEYFLEYLEENVEGEVYGVITDDFVAYR